MQKKQSRGGLPLLVIQHEDDAPVGWLGEAWEAAGQELDVRHPYLHLDEPRQGLPDDLEDFAGLVVLGGEMDAEADDRYPWLTTTKELLRSAVDRGMPTLGVCLGHQLLCVALGGAIGRNPDGLLAGRLPLTLTDDGGSDPLLRLLDDQHVTHLNGDVVTELPSGSTVLAKSPDGSVQAARVAPHAWGLQFHPEAGPEVYAGWPIDATNLNPVSDAEPLLGVRAHAAELRAVNDVIAHRFLTVSA